MNREQIRVNQLNKRFHDVLHGRVILQPANARLFLESICVQEDPAKCVGNLVSNPHGTSSVQNAMRFDLSLPFLNGLATDVLDYLLRAGDLGGGVLDHILIAIVDPSFFWLALAREFEKGALSEKAQLVFAKLLDRLLSLPGRDTSGYRELASKPSVINSLVASSVQEIREIAHHIKHILAAFASGATPSGPGGPGGRHDNDFTNFREIAILPTADEILSNQPPFIRPAAVLEDPKAVDSRVADYLDNTFRMLREDMIYEMREELQIALGKKPGKHRGLHINGLSMIDVHTGSQDRGTRWGLMLTLSTQHRMRPEISAFIRALTYPELVDHSNTLNRPDIRGVQSNVVFVDHSRPEDVETRITDRGDVEATSSKQNTYEVEMVVKIVRYLKQQGYKSENMVVLTPYLGQLCKLRDTLKNDAVLNDLDANDLQKAGLLAPVATQASQQGIRLATIDNYQGEESDIVIASLTRSNPNNAIGFMSSPERLNVLLSRARDGLFLIGNSHTFLNSKKGGNLWEDFFSLLRKGRHVFEGFPIKCERHPTRTVTIKEVAEFDDQSPDGGCTQPCGMLLQCQIHQCPKKCHPLRTAPNKPDIHLSTLCKHPFQEKCPIGVHTMSWKCHQGRPATCSLCDRQASRLEKQAMLDIKAQEKRDAAQHEYDIKMMELQAKLQYQQEAMNDVQVEKDRENEIKQKEKEVEDAKQKIRDIETAKKSAAKKLAAQSTSGATASQGQPQAGANGAPQAAATPRPIFPSPARDKWENQKRVDGVQNDAIDKIMDMTGLEKVKDQILRIKGNIDTMNRQGIPINKERLNLVLLGNPGTGKTTVARLYAQFLESIKALPGNAFLETTGSKLSFEGVKGAQQIIDDALKVGGGAIFIDEAYQLVSEHDQSGKQVLDFLLAEMENQVGTLVFILAGYNKQMEKFFEHNPGLPSRVPYQLQFADYTDKELLTMLEDLVHKRYNGRMQVEDGINGLYARIAIKRLGRGRGRPGFGNARALQNMFAKIRERQAERVEQDRRAGSRVDDFLLTKEDLIGPDPSQVLPNSAPWAK
ncbi:hypothetical protein PAXINDRAFT_139878, partial [Paxillus involutus ATCC 200175]